MLKAVYPVLGMQTALPFYVSGIGICEPEYRVSRPQGLVSHQFLITSSGSGMLIVGEREYILKEGSIFYLPPELPHEYMQYSGQWNTKWLVFRGEHADDLMKRMGFDRDMYADVYRDMQPLTLDDIVRFEKANMAHKPFRYIILGDEKELDMEALGKIGPIRRLTTEEIFGY